jgi:hypothetical protein
MAAASPVLPARIDRTLLKPAAGWDEVLVAAGADRLVTSAGAAIARAGEEERDAHPL